MIDWYLAQTFVVFQLYLDVNKSMRIRVNKLKMKNIICMNKMIKQH